MVYKLNNPRVWRTYSGGANIDRRYGISSDMQHPEEWIVSDTAANGRIQGEGLSLVPSIGVTLKSMISDNPVAMLGAHHVRKYGPRLGVLTKLIDSSERLTIQVHPDKKKAMELFSSPFGKTECWYILNDTSIYAGFRKGVTRDSWYRLFVNQDIEGMLDSLNRLSVKPGDTVLIPGGFPHAIGKDAFLIEIQESTDYTLRVERTTPKGNQLSDEMCHLGIGFENVFDCFDYETYTEDEVRDRFFLKPEVIESSNGSIRTRIVGYSDTPCFSMEVVEGSAHISCDGVFAGIFCYKGSGYISSSESRMGISQCDQYFVPSFEKAFDLESEHDLTVFVIRGPES